MPGQNGSCGAIRPPQPGALGALKHTLDVYADHGDDMPVLCATTNVFAAKGEPSYWTGVTLGDLRDVFSLATGGPRPCLR
jgi:hypothetical protein